MGYSKRQFVYAAFEEIGLAAGNAGAGLPVLRVTS